MLSLVAAIVFAVATLRYSSQPFAVVKSLYALAKPTRHSLCNFLELLVFHCLSLFLVQPALGTGFVLFVGSLEIEKEQLDSKKKTSGAGFLFYSAPFYK